MLTVTGFGRNRLRTNLHDRLVTIFAFFEAKGGKRRFIPLGDQIQIRTAAVALATTGNMPSSSSRKLKICPSGQLNSAGNCGQSVGKVFEATHLRRFHQRASWAGLSAVHVKAHPKFNRYLGNGWSLPFYGRHGRSLVSNNLDPRQSSAKKTESSGQAVPRESQP